MIYVSKIYKRQNLFYTSYQFILISFPHLRFYHSKTYAAMDSNSHPTSHLNGYPPIGAEDFQIRIAQKLEFRDFHNSEGLYPHQEFLRRYLSPYTPYKGLLLFHSLGSGKSLGCISVAVDHHIYDGKKAIIITKGDSGASNFAKEIQIYARVSGRDYSKLKNIFEYHRYIALSHKIVKMDDEEIINVFENKIIILDEAHNIKDTCHDGVYSCLIKIMDLTRNTKIILATGTPMTDTVQQIIPVLNVLFPKERRLNFQTKDIPNSILSGIISYNTTVIQKPREIYHGNQTIQNMKIVSVTMTGHQLKYYEEESKKDVNDIYRSLSQISSFVFPDGSYGREINSSKYYRTKQKKLITYPDNVSKRITYQKYFLREEFRKYLSGDLLRMSSCKYYSFLEHVSLNTRYPAFVFVDEVRGSGLMILSLILEQHGYELYLGENLDTIDKGKRYTFCVGSTDISPNNENRLDGFNSPKNKNGDYVQILLGSKVIGESITLKNVKQFHGITPHWNDSTVEQAVGRVIRSGSHDMLPEDERYVDIYIYAAVTPDNKGVDKLKLEICAHKQMDIVHMKNKLKDVAVDKYIFREKIPEKELNLDITTFVLYHVDSYMDLFVIKLREIFENKTWLFLSDVLDAIDVNEVIFMEAIYKLITTNDNRINPNTFLRISGDILYLTSDPLLPFEYVCGALSWETPSQPKDIFERKVEYLGLDELDKYNNDNPLDIIRSMQHIKDKILFLESALMHKRYDLIAPLWLLWYMADDNTYYHIMCYREEEVAYRASKLIPKKLNGKTRVFTNGKWAYLDDCYEECVMDVFIHRFDLLTAQISKYPLFGFISILDNHMRIKVEYMRKGSDKDRRMDRRGRSLTSLKKIDLAVILVLLQTYVEKVNKTSSSHVAIKETNEEIWKKLTTTYGPSLDPYIDIINEQQILERIWVTANSWNAKRIRELINQILMMYKLYIIL